MSTSKWGVGGNAVDKSVIDRAKGNGTVHKVGKYWIPDFTDRVRAGMDLLDKVNPGWQDTLDFSNLDLESDQNCVLGQSWPLYAEAHGIIEKADGDYKEFANTVLSVGGKISSGERNNMAAAIGCALSGEDFHILNAQPDSDTIPEAVMQKDVIVVVHKAPPLLNLFWEQLTKTWISEIVKARAEGRWSDTVSSVEPVSTES